MAFSQIVRYPINVLQSEKHDESNQKEEAKEASLSSPPPPYQVVIRHAKNRDADDLTMFPDFFSPDFSVGTTTGLIRVWDGTYVLLKYIENEMLQMSKKNTPEPSSAHHHQQNSSHHYGFESPQALNCIELGSGAGLLGLCLSAMGANVLLTDVASSVDCITKPNVLLNAWENREEKARVVRMAEERERKTEKEVDEGAPPSTSNPTESSVSSMPPMTSSVEPFFVPDTPSYSVGVNGGRAAALPLNWAASDLSQIDARIVASLPKCNKIIACDCIWNHEFASMCSSICGKILPLCMKGTRILLTNLEREGDCIAEYRAHIEAYFKKAGMCIDWIRTIAGSAAGAGGEFNVAVLEAYLPEQQ